MESWERLEKVIEWSSMSAHGFAMKIGMKESESLYRIIRNEENIDTELMELILEKNPEINKNWLVYDKGEMLDENRDKDSKIPYYPNFMINSKLLGNNEASSDMYIPHLQEVDFATIANDGALEPTIPAFSTIILKKPLSDIIVFGKIYCVNIDGFKMIRIIRKIEGSDDKILLKVTNDKYDDIIIDRNILTEIYLVSGVLSSIL